MPTINSKLSRGDLTRFNIANQSVSVAFKINLSSCVAIDSAALVDKLLNDLLKTTEGFQKLKKMHEELKQRSSGDFDQGLKAEIEKVQRENNQLHQQMI